jgi:outer membrane lipoprotein-sorting protein
MTKKLYCILFLISVSLASVFASPPDTTYKVLKDTALLKSRITTYSKGLLTLESNFVQMKYLSVLTVPSKSSGYFCFKNPGMVRWEYTEPFKYLVVIKNDRLYMKDDNKTKSYEMTSSKAFVALSSGLGQLLQGDIFTNKTDFSCKYFENDANYKLILVPRAKELKKIFSSVLLYFDKKLFSVSKVVMFELSGDKTEIEFTDRKINESIADEKFNIK